MNDKMKPAMMGGAILGILSVIPVVSAVNVCCCAWAILGGLLATYMYVKGSATPATIGDGAMLGALAGVIGAVIYVVLGIPIGLLTSNASMNAMVGVMERMNPEMGAEMRRQAEAMQGLGTGEILVAMLPGMLMGAVALVVFATIGGLIGVPIFEKRKGGGAGTPPPPPPDFGGPAGGGYGGPAGTGYGGGSAGSYGSGQG